MKVVSVDRSSNRRRRVLLVAGATLVADVLSKIAGVALLGEGSVGVGPVRLDVVLNSGFAFGIGANLSARVVVVVTAIVIAVLVFAAMRGFLADPLAAGLVLGGAIANLVDRAIDGTVVDLIDIGPWPTFNLADVSIVIGLLLVTVLGRSKVGSSPGRPETNPSGMSKEG